MNRGPWSFFLALALLVSTHGAVHANNRRGAQSDQRPAHSAAQAIVAGADTQEQPQTFRSSVDLVTIQASVRDHRGRPLRGLTPADFEVRDNGQLRPVLSLRA